MKQNSEENFNTRFDEIFSPPASFPITTVHSPPLLGVSWIALRYSFLVLYRKSARVAVESIGLDFGFLLILVNATENLRSVLAMMGDREP